MAKKKIIGLVTLSLAGVMALSSFAFANDRNTDSQYTKTTAQTEQSAQPKLDKSEKPERKENIFKTKRGLINKDILKSVLNLTDEEFNTKLAEHDNNVYKLLEAYGKVEEYKTAYLRTIKEKLDKAVAENKITKEKADAIYAKAEEAIKSFNVESGNLGMPGERAGGLLESFKETFNFNLDDLQEEIGKAIEVFNADDLLGDLREKMGKHIEVFGSFENKAELKDGMGFSFGLDKSMLCEVLGISEEELKTKLVENNGNLYKVLEEMDKVEEYKAAVLKMTKEALDRAVAEGRITQENADSIYASSKEMMNNCDGKGFSVFIRPELGENVFKKEFRRDKDGRKKTTEPTQETTIPSPTSSPAAIQNNDI